MNKLGVYFGTEKLEALLRGDTSNTVINRHFVYGFQAIGMYLSGTPEESPAMVRLQAGYAWRAWESLIEIRRAGYQKLAAQGVLLFAHALIVMGFPETARLYLSNLCEIINEAKLQFLPVHGCPAELSEQVREDAATLSQAIYLENYFYLSLGGPAPMMTVRIEREFRLDLQVRTIQQFFTVGLKMDSATWSSECIHFYSMHAH